MAFQCNATNDQSHADASFTKKFEKMKKDLPRKEVHVAGLNANMRNTNNIGSFAKDIKTVSNSADNKMTQAIPTLEVKTNVKSTPHYTSQCSDVIGKQISNLL